MEEKALKGELTEEFIENEDTNLRNTFQQLISLNESSLQSLISLLNNKLTYSIQLICNDLIYIKSNRKILPNGPIDKRSEKTRSLIYEVPRFWKANQIYNYNTIKLHNQSLRYLMHLWAIYRRLNREVDNILNVELKGWIGECYNLINRGQNPTHEILRKSKNFVNNDKFDSVWNQLIEWFLESVNESTDEVIPELYLFKQDRYEDYKENQFQEGNGVNFPVRSLIRHVSENLFIEPFQKYMEDARGAILEIIGKLVKMDEFLNTVQGNITDQKKNEDEYKLLQHAILNETGVILNDLDKIIVRLQNHIKERTTAMSDKLTISSLLNYYENNRRRIK